MASIVGPGTETGVEAAWLRGEGLTDSPIVLKPQESGVTDDVFVACPVTTGGPSSSGSSAAPTS